MPDRMRFPRIKDAPLRRLRHVGDCNCSGLPALAQGAPSTGEDRDAGSSRRFRHPEQRCRDHRAAPRRNPAQRSGHDPGRLPRIAGAVRRLLGQPAQRPGRGFDPIGGRPGGRPAVHQLPRRRLERRFVRQRILGRDVPGRPSGLCARLCDAALRHRPYRVHQGARSRTSCSARTPHSARSSVWPTGARPTAPSASRAATATISRATRGIWSMRCSTCRSPTHCRSASRACSTTMTASSATSPPDAPRRTRGTFRAASRCAGAHRQSRFPAHYQHSERDQEGQFLEVLADPIGAIALRALANGQTGFEAWATVAPMPRPMRSAASQPVPLPFE